MALTPQDLFEIRKIIVASKLLDSNAFDEDIKRMEQAVQSQQQLHLDTIAFEKEKVANALQDMHNDLDIKEESLQKQFDEIVIKNKLIDEKQEQLNNTAAEVGAQMDALALLSKSTKEEVESLNAEAAERIKAAEDRERDVSLREQALASGQADLASKLQALKALSA